MLVLADFSTQLCELIFARDLDAAAFADRSAELAARFNHLLPGVGVQIPALVANIGVQFSRLKHGLGIRSLPLKCVDRLKDRAAKRDPQGTVAAKTAAPSSPENGPPAPPAPGAKPPAPAAPPPPKPTISSARLTSGLAQLVALAARPGTPADVIYRSVIDILGEAFNAPEVVLFLRAPGLPALHITHGCGQNWRTLQHHAKITPGERTTFGLCLARKENLLIHDATEASIAPYVPGWLRGAAHLQAYVLLPMVLADKPVGVILAGWAVKRKIAIAPDQVQLLRELLAIVAQKHGPA